MYGGAPLIIHSMPLQLTQFRPLAGGETVGTNAPYPILHH